MNEFGMNEFESKTFESNLNILLDALNKKHEFLTRILTITENQGAVLIAEAENNRTGAAADNQILEHMFRQMNDERQALIDKLIDSDMFFQRVFKEISPDFEKFARNFIPVIEKMQNAIRNVSDLDIKIRNQEQKNKVALQGAASGSEPPKKVKAEVDFTKASKSYMLKQYEMNSDKKE